MSEENRASADTGPSNRGGWRDDPIVTSGQDQLSRGSFARHAARLIHENHSAASSVVYGLEGPWGSGKSSILALVTEYLAEPEESPWVIVQFTPWATTGTDALLAEFLAALSTAAREAGAERRLRDQILDYADIARPLAALIPLAGAAAVEASKVVESRLRKPWHAAFAEVSEGLRRLGIPILVVVDDIDRLQPSELMDLLRVVRLLGRFPGVDFLLAYDEETIVDTLQDPARGHVTTARARAFMEKIVQYPLSVPPLLTGKIVRLLDEGLTEILSAERTESGFDKDRFSRMILNTMPSQLNTPRAIERFLAQVREQFRMHDRDEINDVDLILATFLRVRFPDLFAKLQRWKGDLTRSSSGVLTPAKREKAAPDWDPLLKSVDGEGNQQDARAVLETLFPAMTREGSRPAPGRFAHPDYFDRYLAQAIPEADIPDSRVSRALAMAARGEPDELRALVLVDDEEQVTLALSKIRARYPDIGEPWTRGADGEGPVTVQLLSAGMDLLQVVNGRITSWTSVESQVTYWMANVIRLLLDGDPNAGSELDAALARCSNMHRRAHVIWAAGGHLDDVRDETKEALQSLAKREAERLLPNLLEDLRLRDKSSYDSGSAFIYGFVEKAGLLDQLASGVQAGLDAGDFSQDDVGARLVGFAYLVGGPDTPSSASFPGELFTKLTAIPAQSTDHNERQTWSDTSWAKRREFASRYIGGEATADQTD
jgi:hypothetical protein